jgi:hypothetical protein
MNKKIALVLILLFGAGLERLPVVTPLTSWTKLRSEPRKREGGNRRQDSYVSGVICSYENFGISARSLACSIVMAQIWPLLSRSKRVLSSRTLVSATSLTRNSM